MPICPQAAVLAHIGGFSKVPVGGHQRPAIRGTDVTEHWIGLPHQSALMLAARITLAHFSVSSTTIFSNSAGDIGIGTLPSSARRALIFSSARAAFISC